MTVKLLNDALEQSLRKKDSYTGLVHTLSDLECSDQLIKTIVVGAFGERVRNRIDPLLAMVRSYEGLSSTEQVDILYSIVQKQDARAEANKQTTKIAG
jgi:hypothetical protein